MPGNITTDIIILALPIPVLWRLNLPRSQRISLVGIFCLGFFTCCISIVRVAFIANGSDDTYDNVSASGWSIGELGCGIIASCLPTLRPLVFKIWPSLGSNKGTRVGDGPTLQTFGGGYVGNGNSRSDGSKTTRMNRTVKSQAMESQLHGSSTEELTWSKLDDIEMNMTKSQSEKSANNSTESMRTQEEATFPIQRPTHQAKKDEFLGLRGATLTTIKATPEQRPITPSYPVASRGGAGIQIKRDVTQKSGPAFH